MKPVDIVKIEKLISIYKDDNEANSIQVARIIDSDNNSCEFNIIVGKGLYNIGDKVVYIMPDYSIPNTLLFREYYEPGGDSSKSRLGKRGRVRAIKFNFTFKDEVEPIYSNGILLPLTEINKFLNDDKYNIDELQEKLEVIKYVADDSFESLGSGLSKGDLPSFLYGTEEERIELRKGVIQKCFEENEILAGTIKVDGSSISQYVRLNPLNIKEYNKGICSRKQEKNLEQTYINGYIDTDNNVLHKYYNRETQEDGWYNDFKQKFYTNQDVIDLELKEITVELRDAFVDTVNKWKYLDKLEDYCKKYNLQLALRGELIGAGASKGSGNKYNMDTKGDARVRFFGVDDLSTGYAKRINYSNEHNLKRISEELDLEYTQHLFEGVYDYDGLIKVCNSIFKDIKERTGQIVEGIVIRTMYSNKLSTKYLNPEYDSKK